MRIKNVVIKLHATFRLLPLGVALHLLAGAKLGCVRVIREAVLVGIVYVLSVLCFEALFNFLFIKLHNI